MGFFQKSFESNVEKGKSEIAIQKLPDEIANAPNPDFKLPWKDKPEITIRKLPDEIANAPDPDFKLPWKNKDERLKSIRTNHDTKKQELTGEQKAKIKEAHSEVSWPIKMLRSLFARDDAERQGLTEEQKAKIKEAHPDWPDEIIDAITSWKEYKIYDKARLVYAEINGKPCLIRSDIDLNQKDEYGRTNKERMEQGLAPLDKNGKSIDLHHIGQKSDGPLAELTKEEHQGNDRVLHDKTKDTEIDRKEFDKERNEHWKTRANQAQ